MVDFDIIVVGAGHAGCEAALAASRLGKTVLMVTMRHDHIGRLSCNPAVGGLAKGNLVREIDALGGAMGRVADRSTIQFRRLNTRKGLAVQASRAQVDIDLYPLEMRTEIDAAVGLTVREGEAVDLLVDGQQIQGVVLGAGDEIRSESVILTTGTFLSAVMHCGKDQVKGGRVGESSASRLSERLKDLGLRLGRLKTGTTPRLDGRTIQWERLEVQEETMPHGHFSFKTPSVRLPQIDCHIAYTNSTTHQIIRDGLERSPLFSGQIEGRGPRYCPSIEDKIVRFAQRDRHQLFIEPEGLNTDRVYVNGLSTSLPADIQLAMVRSIEGMEKAEILQNGYAVEYDFADPRDLGHDLQHKTIPGLYLAGQVNGTSGYEEAAAQGLVAGVSAAIGEPFVLGREQAYMGVLIDDLVTRGVGGEPYRMFSSRAEHRLLLREDNADRRLMPIGRSIGLVGDEDWAQFCQKLKDIESAQSWCENRVVKPDAETVKRFEALGESPPRKPLKVVELLRRPTLDWGSLESLMDGVPAIDVHTAEQVETDIKYAGYLAREAVRAERTRKMADVRIPEDMNYDAPGISSEVAERLRAAQPKTLGAAARLPGVTPAAIDMLAVLLARRRAG